MHTNCKRFFSTGALVAVLGLSAGTPARAILATHNPLGNVAADNLEIVRISGGERTVITNGSEAAQFPDGSGYIVTAKRLGRDQLVRIGPNGENPVNISDPTKDESQAAFSPNGILIDFVSDAGNGAGIVTMHSDGTDRLLRTSSGLVFQYSNPRVSPDGKRIFDCRNLPNGPDSIIIQDADGSNTRLLLPDVDETRNGRWSADGAEIVFDYRYDLGRGIGKVNADGTGLVLTQKGAVGLKPEPRRRLLGVGAKNQQTPVGDTNPRWANNGQQIIYESDVDGNGEIYIMNADGTGRTNLTNNPANDSAAVWVDSDGSILFVSDRSGNNDIFVMNSDGSGQTNLTNSPGDESDPQPLIVPITAPPVISENGIVLATLLPSVGTVSPGSIISVFGSDFSVGTALFPELDGEGKLGTKLTVTCFEMGGERMPAFAVTPTQANLQTPVDAPLGPVAVVAVRDCDTAFETRSLVEMVTVEAATPGFFIFDPIASDGFIAARFNATTEQPAVPVAPTSLYPNDDFGPSRPGQPGDIIVMYGTGWGTTVPSSGTGELAASAAALPESANVMITFGGVVMDASDVLYVGVTPGTAGLLQAAIRIPANAQAGNNQVVLTAYGKSTPVGPVVPVVVP